MNRTPIRRLARDIVYDGRIIRIERDHVQLAHGGKATMEAVRHRGSVVLIPQPTERQVILVRQYRYVVGRWLWELPAGSLEAGEAPARAARRECEEEIGWHPEHLQRLGTFYPSPGFCDERMIFYRCAGLRKPRRARAQDPDEQIEPRAFTLQEAWRLVARGQSADMKTIVGLTLLTRRGSRTASSARGRR